MATIIYCCPSSTECSWEGGKDALLAHFAHAHEDYLVHGSEFFVALHTDESHNYTMNFLMHWTAGDLYLLQVQVAKCITRVRVRYAGDPHVAAQRRFRIAVCSVDNATSAFRYEVRNGDGCVEIACTQYEAVKDIAILTCEIVMDEMAKEQDEDEFLDAVDTTSLPVEQKLQQEEQQEVEEFQNQDQDQDKEEKKEILFEKKHRPSFGSSRRLRRSLDKSIHKSDQSLFYLEEFLAQDTQQDEDLMDLLEDRIELLRDYKCKRCDYYITGPIYRCAAEHSLCAACREDHGRCPCSVHVGEDQRCATLEATRDAMQLPCRFEGCAASVPGGKLQQHQVQCNHCVYICPECKALIGKYVDVEKHFRIVHPSIRRTASLDNVLGLEASALIMHPHGVFYARAKSDATAVEWSVQHCGHIRIHFECHVHVKSNKPGASRTFRLQPADTSGAKNTYAQRVGFKDVKASRLRAAVLKISLYGMNE